MATSAQYMEEGKPATMTLGNWRGIGSSHKELPSTTKVTSGRFGLRNPDFHRGSECLIYWAIHVSHKNNFRHRNQSLYEMQSTTMQKSMTE